MKTAKSVLITLLLITGSIYAIAQKGQLTALQEIGDGSVFKKYWGITKEGDTYSSNASSEMCQIKFENNVNGKFSTFVLNKEGTNTVLINSGFGFLKPNHYTEPSAFHSNRHNLAYVYIDGLLYALKGIRDPKNITTFKIEEIFALSKPAKGEHTSGKAAAKEIKNRNHDAVLEKYFKDMKAVQDNATANFTPEIIAEVDAVEGNEKAKDKDIKDTNAAYWASAEGQKNLGEMRQEKIIFINDTGADVGMCYGQGVSTVLKPGEKHTFSCKNGKVYRGEKIPNNTVNLKRTDKVLLDLNGTNCGAQITASSVL